MKVFIRLANMSNVFLKNKTNLAINIPAMKHAITTVVFVCAILTVKAQADVILSHTYRYKQNKWMDSLRNAHKLSTVMINPQPLLVYDMPVMPLENEGEEAGLAGEDTIYRMKTDNMLLLKPNRDANPPINAIGEKLFTIPPVKKKP